MPGMEFRFGGSLLDVERGVLTAADGTPTALRPKTLELARFLISNAGRVVSRAEILDAVWPGVFVTDDSVTQCVVELRKALGGDASLLRTIPRRGYLLEAKVSLAETPTSAEQPVERSTTDDRRSGSPSPARPWLSLTAAGLLAVGIGAWLLRADPSAAPPAQQTSVERGSVPPVPSLHPDAEAPPSAAERSMQLLAEGRAAMRRQGRIADLRLEARRIFEQAVEIDPGNFRAMTEIVFTYTNAVLAGDSVNPEADLRRAEIWAERATAIEPRHAATFNARAAVFRQQRRHEEALRSYRLAVEFDPTAHPARANIGFMLLMAGRGEEAAAPVLAAIAARPEPLFLGTWNTYLGLIQLHTGKDDHGVARLREGMQFSAFMPLHERMLYLVAALWQNGEREAAADLATDLATRQPEYGLEWLAGRPLSDHPTYRTQFARILEAVRNARAGD